MFCFSIVLHVVLLDGADTISDYDTRMQLITGRCSSDGIGGWTELVPRRKLGLRRMPSEVLTYNRDTWNIAVL